MADIFDAIRDQMDAVHAASSARDPLKRVYVTSLIPVGATYLAPFDDRQGAHQRQVPMDEWRVDDGGPVQLLINPADWEGLVRTMGGASTDAPLLAPMVGSLMGITVVRDHNG